jgi:hypothetical protein
VVWGNEEEPPPQERLSASVGATTRPVEGTGTTATATEEPRGPREGLILLLFALITIAASAFVLWNAEQAAVDDPKQKAARGEVTGLDELSMIREANVQRALDEVEASDWPLVRNIRIAPTSIDIQASDSDGIGRNMTFDPAFEVTETDGGASTVNAKPASKIDAAAPERAIRGAAERAGLDTDEIDYVTTTFIIDSDSDWSLFFKSGPAKDRHWIAEPDGTDVRRPGELSREQEAEQRRQQRELARMRRIFQKRNECLSRATTGEQVTRCVERFTP